MKIKILLSSTSTAKRLTGKEISLIGKGKRVFILRGLSIDQDNLIFLEVYDIFKN